MAQQLNQFVQSVEKGMLDLTIGVRSVISCQIDSSSAGSLVAGQAVKLVNVAGGIPNVVETNTASDDIFGFIVYNIKDQSYDAGEKVEIAFYRAAIMYMEASAAIVPQAKVMISASQTVATATATNRIVGTALDKASASGALIRVMIDLPGSVA